jgi:hypothetical protein
MLLKMAVQNESIKMTIDDTTTGKITGLNYGKQMYVDKTSLRCLYTRCLQTICP